LSAIHPPGESMSRIHKELKILNIKRTNNPVHKWVIELNRHFSNDKIQMINKYMKKIQHLKSPGKGK
jgi:hypothetical protein